MNISIRALFTAALAAACLLAPRLDAQDQPQDWLYAAKKQTDNRPCKVDALIQGGENMRIRGMLSGSDFDVTVQTPAKNFRQIQVGSSYWISSDSGKTWRKADSPDLRYFYLAHTPIRFIPGEKIPPFEALKTLPENGETLQHIRFISPEPEQYDQDRPNYWIRMDGDKPGTIKRFAGPLVFDNDYVPTLIEYTMLSATSAILPPPGNPEAAPKPGPEDLLIGALNNMDAGGPIEVHATLTYKKVATFHGIIFHRDFDLVQEGTVPVHSIAIKDRAWGSFDNGKTWRKEDPDDRLAYGLLYAPIVPGHMQMTFEVLGKEQHDGQTWLHIAGKRDSEDQSLDEVPQYWIQIDGNGNPVYVRRYQGAVLTQGQMIKSVEAFEPAPPDTAINPPVK